MGGRGVPEPWYLRIPAQFPLNFPLISQENMRNRRHRAPGARDANPQDSTAVAATSINIPVLLHQGVAPAAADGATAAAAATLAPALVIVEHEISFANADPLPAHIVAGLAA